MDYTAHIDAAEREAAAAAKAFAAGPLDITVPTCPDWQLSVLAQHLGEFSGFWTHVLCEGTGRPKPPAPHMPDNPGGVAAWYAELGALLVAELRATPPDTEVWTWVDDKTAGFIARRVANELAVHRFDAQMARHAPEPIDAALAADGIDEIFVMTAARGEPSGEAAGETLHVHGTDQDRDDEWLITLGPERVEMTHEHAKGDLALRGATSDLELLLYQRPTLGEVERFGDEAVLDAWYREFKFG
jgi:uncharacterized protein (TIGR03083 family)